LAEASTNWYQKGKAQSCKWSNFSYFTLCCHWKVSYFLYGVWWNYSVVYYTDNAVMILYLFYLQYNLLFSYIYIYIYISLFYFLCFWCKCRNFRSNTTVFLMSTMCRHCLQYVPRFFSIIIYICWLGYVFVNSIHLWFLFTRVLFAILYFSCAILLAAWPWRWTWTQNSDLHFVEPVHNKNG
jgi:hypothetical protein